MPDPPVQAKGQPSPSLEFDVSIAKRRITLRSPLLANHISNATTLQLFSETGGSDFRLAVIAYVAMQQDMPKNVFETIRLLAWDADIHKLAQNLGAKVEPYAALRRYFDEGVAGVFP